MLMTILLPLLLPMFLVDDQPVHRLLGGIGIRWQDFNQIIFPWLPEILAYSKKL